MFFLKKNRKQNNTPAYGCTDITKPMKIQTGLILCSSLKSLSCPFISCSFIFGHQNIYLLAFLPHTSALLLCTRREPLTLALPDHMALNFAFVWLDSLVISWYHISSFLHKEETAGIWNKKDWKAKITGEEIFHAVTTAAPECSSRHKMFLTHEKSHSCSMLWICNHVLRLGISHLEWERKERTFFSLLNSLFISKGRRKLETDGGVLCLFFLIGQSIENASVSLKWCDILCCDYYWMWSYLSEQNNFVSVEVWGDLIISKSVPVL